MRNCNKEDANISLKISLISFVVRLFLFILLWAIGLISLKSLFFLNVLNFGNIVVTIIKKKRASKIKLCKKQLLRSLKEFFELIQDDGNNNIMVDYWFRYYKRKTEECKKYSDYKALLHKVNKHIERIKETKFSQEYKEEENYYDFYGFKFNEFDFDSYYKYFKQRWDYNNQQRNKNENLSKNVSLNLIQKSLGVLGLPLNTNDIKIIKKQYIELIKRYHPDVCKDLDAEEKTKELNSAYESLQKVFA